MLPGLPEADSEASWPKVRIRRWTVPTQGDTAHLHHTFDAPCLALGSFWDGGFDGVQLTGKGAFRTGKISHADLDTQCCHGKAEGLSLPLSAADKA